MKEIPENLQNVDWSQTTFEGAQRAHVRRWRQASFEEVIRSLEEMEVLMSSWIVKRA